MKLPSNVTLCDVGLRDGLQNEDIIIKTSDKLEIAKNLIDAGFKVIELGSFMHPKLVPQMADTDKLFMEMKDIKDVELRALVPNKKGIERAINSGCRKVKLNVSASMGHNLSNFNMTPKESMKGFQESYDFAKENGIDVSGSIAMAFDSPWEGEISIEDLKSIIDTYIEVGINEISLSDSSGMAVPNQVYSICNIMKENYPQVKWWLHFHNTRGLAIANVLAAMQAGMTNFDSSVGGLGGCPFIPDAAGNLATEDIVHMMDEMGIDTGIDVLKLLNITKKMKKMVGHDMDSYLPKAGRSKDLLV